MKLKEKPEDFKVREVPGFSLTNKGSYGIYRLKKKLWNTEDAVQEIAKQLKIPRKRIGYSGAKDRQAITEQYISIEGVFNPEVDIKDIELEPVGKSQVPISLGDHTGNDFEIIVRDCEEKPRELNRIVNYFGKQRFSENNEEVGKAIVKGDFKKSCQLITEAGGKNSRIIKEHLEKKENDYVGALKKIPKKTASLYVHAYQSSLWNRVAEQLATTKKQNCLVPLVGFGTSFSDEEVRELYEQLLEEDNVSKRDFAIKQYPRISAKGTERTLYANLERLKIEEMDEETYRIRFFLPKGAYATEAINQLFSR